MSKFNQIQSDLFKMKQVVFVDSFFQNLNDETLGSNKSEAFTLLLKCEQLGFSFDNKLLNIVSHAKTSEMEKFWDWMVKMNKEVYSSASYKPMYPNFPKQVIEASEVELLVNAFMHYTGDLFGIRIMPSYKEKARKGLKESVNPLRMSVITEEVVPQLFIQNITANTSASEASKELIKNIFNYMVEKDKTALGDILVSNPIPQKENLAFVGALVLNSEIDFNQVMANQFKTPTDLLRLSAALNGGDTSLVKDTKIKKMSRPMRKAFAAKLESMIVAGDKEQFLENMFTYKEQWTRLAHAIHIGEYQNKCPNAFELIQKVRSNDKGESFNFKVEKLITEGKTVQASQELKVRPGVFGRMLNQVLVKSANEQEQDLILENFKSASKSIATPVLLQMHAKFKYDNQNEKKIILPKGGLGKVYVRDMNEKPVKVKVQKPAQKKVVVPDYVPPAPTALENALQTALKNKLGVSSVKEEVVKEVVQEAIKEVATQQEVTPKKEYVPAPGLSDAVAQKVVSLIEETLIERFSNGPSLGNVFIEESLTLQNIPFAQRTASKALKTVPKGSRFVKESDKPIIRFFTWWNENGVDKNGKPVNVGRVDIDLSVGVYDTGYNLIKTCSYYDLRSSDYLAHSGDITSAPNGAAEYIDVNIEKMLEDVPGAAYVGQLISSFSMQKYVDIPECYAGWMEREQKQHGDIFEASTVKNKVDITCDSTQVLVCLYDIARKEYIWADTPITERSYYSNNLHSVKGAMAYTIQGLAEMKKPNLYDLFEMHAKARGTIVTDKSQAQTVFSIHEGITPFDSEVIASEFMADEYSKQELSKKLKVK